MAQNRKRRGRTAKFSVKGLQKGLIEQTKKTITTFSN